MRSVGSYKDPKGIRLGGCPGLAEYSLGEQIILLDLSCSSSLIFHNGKKCTGKL